MTLPPGKRATLFPLVQRLAYEKANKVTNMVQQPSHLTRAPLTKQQSAPYLVIGSDQIAVIKDEILGKPGNLDAAMQQLRKLSGEKILFLTSLCVIDIYSGQRESLIEPYYVSFRELSDGTIERYLKQEEPYDCAGSFKSEGMGICLFTELSGRDPNALIGLPLIGLIDLLKKFGVECP